MVGRNEFDVVAINDISNPQMLGHLFKYDSIYGKFEGNVEVKDNLLIINGKGSEIVSERDITRLPWKKFGVEFVVESTGIYTTREQCEHHIRQGAKKVLLTAPSKDSVDTTVVMGVNHKNIKKEDKVISNASCTTNCLAPVVKVLNDNFGLVRGFMTTVHAFTNDQRTADQVHKDPRRARAASINIIPTTTGAAKAIGLVIPELQGKIDGVSMRVPVACGSLIDLVAELKKSVTCDEINSAMKIAASKNLKNILEYTEDPIVSSDIIGNSHSSIFDAKSTMVVGKKGNFIKVLSWYDNEWGYSCRCADVLTYCVNNELI